jgi:hypothetical protein
LWRDPEQGKLATLKSSSGADVASLAFSPAGNLFAAGLSDGTVDLWRVSDWLNLYTLDGHPGRVLQVIFSEDGKRLVARTPAAVYLWQLSGEIFVLAANLAYPPGTVLGSALSPDGNVLAVADRDNTIWLRAMPSGETLLRLGGHAGGVSGVAFSPDGQFLAAAWKGDGEQIRLVDLWQVEELEGGTLAARYWKTLSAPDEVGQLSFSGDGKVLATASDSGELRLWGIPSGEPIYSPPPGWLTANLNGVFAFGRSGLAAGLATGEVYLWKGLENVAEPRYFTRAGTDGVYPEEATPAFLKIGPSLGYTYTGRERNYQNLYQANVAAPFEIKAPEHLPPGFTFKLAQVHPGGVVTLHYEYTPEPGSAPSAGLDILQYAVLSDLPGYTVGASTMIEEVALAGRYAEFVNGEWLPFANELADQGRPSRKVFWVWDSNADTQRLRWLEGDRLYALHYRPYLASGEAGSYLTKADLIAIAEDMTGLGRIGPDFILTGTIMRGEHGCLVSAKSAGRAVGSRALLGRGQPGRCELVFADRVIQGQRLPFAEIDLNCDGRIERLEIIAAPESPEGSPSFWVALKTPSRTGFYEESWRFSLPDAEPGLFARAETLRVGSCERLLSLQAPGEAEPQLKVFRWNGEDMALVFAAEGLVKGGNDPQMPVGELAVTRLEPEPGRGTCQRIDTFYAWSGRTFAETTINAETGVSCEDYW